MGEYVLERGQREIDDVRACFDGAITVAHVRCLHPQTTHTNQEHITSNQE